MSGEFTLGPLWPMPELVLDGPVFVVPELGLVVPVSVVPELALPAGSVPVIPRLRADTFAAIARLVVSGMQVQARPAVFAARPALVVSGKQVQARSVTFSAIADFGASSLIGAPVFAGEARLIVAGVEQQRRPVELGAAPALSFTGREVQSRAVTFSASAELLAAALETQHRAAVFAAVADLAAPAVETQHRGVTFAAVAENTSTGVFVPNESPMRMNKSGTYVAPYGQTTKVTGWAVDAGYPNTEIVNNELVVNVDGSITANMTLNRGATQSGDQAYIYRNGVQVAASDTNNFNTTRIASWTGTVANGDTLSAYYRSTSGFQSMNITGGFLQYTIN